MSNESVSAIDVLLCPFPDLNNYSCSDKGLLLPLISEYTWPLGVRAVLYLIGMLWCFLGIAIIADIFMCAIEKITSHTRTVKVASSDPETIGYEEVEVKVWNDTVANLTLMALGSSAPEILLSCIEIIGRGFHAGELGPGTIVGSAAFNLFCITGVCIIGVPFPNTRRIDGINVFILTTVFSLFAYVWLVIILIVISPNIVELWEAVLTFIFFPLLVILAYATDRNCFRQPTRKLGSKEEGEEGTELQQHGDGTANSRFSNRLTNFLPWNKSKMQKNAPVSGKCDEDRMRALIKELRDIHPHLSEEDIAKLATARLAEEQPHSRLWYRINATKQIGGKQKLLPTVNPRLASVYDVLRKRESGVRGDGLAVATGNMELLDTGSMVNISDGGRRAVVEFTAAQIAILEKEQRARVSIRRYGRLDCPVTCRLETIDGTAEAVKDYIPVRQTITFAADEIIQHVDIAIVDDNEWEPDEVFFVKLSLDPEDPTSRNATLGKRAIQEITILNDDDPGIFEFEKPSFLIKESIGVAQIPVTRVNGCDGRVTLQWKTEDLTAVSGKDYTGGEGSLVFEHGETAKMIDIVIHNDLIKERDESFKVEIVSADCEGAKIGRISKTIVTIVDDDDFNDMVNRLTNTVNINIDAIKAEKVTWSDQFRNALNVNGGDVENASNTDYVMHFLTFPWKLLFAFVPPPSILNGWVSFTVSLILIGLLTAIVGDLAAIFGCLVGLKDAVTAITFVALGTSLPDLFASRQAATMDSTADNSIGNVTGSNSVNVFLGLGLPWMMAAIFWTTKGELFKVEAGSLGFSVVIFCIGAVVSIILLLMRRYMRVFGRAELGGPVAAKMVTGSILFMIWFIYVLISSLQAYGHITVSF
jgi:solute carrier family 8 (sodium/calcium exchanger)